MRTRGKENSMKGKIQRVRSKNQQHGKGTTLIGVEFNGKGECTRVG